MNDFLGKYRERLFEVICFLTPACIILSIWIPLWEHYHITAAEISKENVEYARDNPNDALIAELQGNSPCSALPWNDGDKLLENAKEILRGNLAWPGMRMDRIEFPISWESVRQLLPYEQFFLHSFTIPRVFLAAYRINGDGRFLIAALDVILDWDKYDRSAWIPHSLHWNDHAASERMLVLCDLWGIYRKHKIYENRTAKTILMMVGRHASFLSDARHFNFATNHGVMQNAALLYFGIFFKGLDQNWGFTKIAKDRLNEQMFFYLNREGVFLEHSPAYHAFGLHLIGFCAFYMKILGQDLPSNWQERYDKAKEFYRSALRPDMSLPAFGDTENEGKEDRIVSDLRIPDKLGDSIRSWKPMKTFSGKTKVYPEAGYAFLWAKDQENDDKDKVQQTAITWSYYPGHAHKHADELSIALWANGHSWWTNAGYWEYGIAGRKYAEGWTGSNAPHLRGEEAESARVSTLLSFSETGTISFYDLQRDGPGDFRCRRQIFRLESNLWVILDIADGGFSESAEVCWNAASEIMLKPGINRGEFLLFKKESEQKLQSFVAGSEKVNIKSICGSKEPFIGWIFVNGKPTPVNTILVKWPADGSWVLNVWTIERNESDLAFLVSAPEMAKYAGPEEWRITLVTKSEKVDLERRQQKIIVKTGYREKIETAELAQPPLETQKNIEAVKKAFQNMSQRYASGLKNPLIDSRKRWTWGILGVFCLQNVLFFLYKKRKLPGHSVLKFLSLLTWIAGGIWVIFIRLV